GRNAFRVGKRLEAVVASTAAAGGRGGGGWPVHIIAARRGRAGRGARLARDTARHEVELFGFTDEGRFVWTRDHWPANRMVDDGELRGRLTCRRDECIAAVVQPLDE